jgi:hypothetical protein
MVNRETTDEVLASGADGEGPPRYYGSGWLFKAAYVTRTGLSAPCKPRNRDWDGRPGTDCGWVVGTLGGEGFGKCVYAMPYDEYLGLPDTRPSDVTETKRQIKRKVYGSGDDDDDDDDDDDADEEEEEEEEEQDNAADEEYLGGGESRKSRAHDKDNNARSRGKDGKPKGRGKGRGRGRGRSSGSSGRKQLSEEEKARAVAEMNEQRTKRSHTRASSGRGSRPRRRRRSRQHALYEKAGGHPDDSEDEPDLLNPQIDADLVLSDESEVEVQDDETDIEEASEDYEGDRDESEGGGMGGAFLLGAPSRDKLRTRRAYPPGGRDMNWKEEELADSQYPHAVRGNYEGARAQEVVVHFPACTARPL